MNVILKSKKNTHYASGTYDGKTIVVKKGSKINPNLQFEDMPQRILELRNDTNVVDSKGVTIIDIEFSSPTSAAQFVTGRSVNGYIAWRIDDKISLKEYREQHSKQGETNGRA